MSNFRKQEEEQPKGSPIWMTTYGDMVTLLLTFFVMLFAFSEIMGSRPSTSRKNALYIWYRTPVSKVAIASTESFGFSP